MKTCSLLMIFGLSLFAAAHPDAESEKVLSPLIRDLQLKPYTDTVRADYFMLRPTFPRDVLEFRGALVAMQHQGLLDMKKTRHDVDQAVRQCASMMRSNQMISSIPGYPGVRWNSDKFGVWTIITPRGILGEVTYYKSDDTLEGLIQVIIAPSLSQARALKGISALLSGLHGQTVILGETLQTAKDPAIFAVSNIWDSTEDDYVKTFFVQEAVSEDEIRSLEKLRRALIEAHAFYIWTDWYHNFIARMSLKRPYFNI